MDTVLDMQIENILRAYQTSGIKEPPDYQKFFPLFHCNPLQSLRVLQLPKSTLNFFSLSILSKKTPQETPITTKTVLT